MTCYEKILVTQPTPDSFLSMSSPAILFMFSYYKKGIKGTSIDDVFTIEDLVSYIIDHPQKEKIKQLWSETYRSDVYDRTKESLPCITPAGLFRNERRKEGFLKPSGYLFFDVDMPTIDMDIESFKKVVIERYKDQVCLLGKSVGGRGIFFYVRMQGLAKENYTSVYEHYRTVIFKELNTDNNAKGVNRAHIIPYDPELYINPDVKNVIPKDILLDTYDDPGYISDESDDKEKETVRIKKNKRICYTPTVSFLPIDHLLSTIRIETEVATDNELFKIDPVNYNKLFIPRKIQDGKKHNTFRALTQGLMYHNPGISLLMIQSFMNYVNQNHTTKPMSQKEMLNTVRHAYNQVVETGEIVVPIKVKKLHFNIEVKMYSGDKSRVAAKVNGLIKTFISVARIERAKEELQKENKKLTKKNIALRSGISLKTVDRNFSKTLNDTMAAINALNRTIDSGVLDTQILNETDNQGIC